MKIAVLGAGISGLSVAKSLAEHFDVQVFEQSDQPGGIAKAELISGVSYHQVGGHCFNSKHEEVLDFVFNKVMPKKEWNLIQRKAEIQLGNFNIPYPIEFSIKDIYCHNKNLAFKIISDFFSCDTTKDSENLLEWFENNFGKTLTNLYFKPYNEKIWNEKLENMSPKWVVDKLPIPDQASVLRSLFEKTTDKMPHRFFYYPKSNSQNTFIEKLAKNLNIRYNYKINQISFNSSTDKWIINNEKEFHLVISTIPLNILPTLIENTPKHILDVTQKLKYNKLTTTLWQTLPTENTWTYIPSGNKLAHRYIHIGNFFSPNQNFTITEAVGEHSFESMLESEKENPFFINPIAHHISDHAYVVFDHNYEHARKLILEYLKQINLYTLGRFGHWDYSNMDICIKKSLEISRKIKEKYN